tara:strand:- start:1058 stop:3505 length:2448 start_codon:yes stop_codon:yes gene_type:complete
MNIIVNDPLELLSYQSGLIQSPLLEGEAKGNSNLDTNQRSIVIGQPVPIVFCRRRNSIGGCLVSPGASEGRYANNSTSNELTVDLMLVISEGQLPTIEIKDVFQRACRVGTWSQTHNRRCGTWLPGNVTTIVSGKTPWNCPAYCGTSGRYENMTTMSYTNTHDDGDTTWSKQVHVFVREGMKLTRILDSTLGPSDNIVDLAQYLITQGSRFPTALIDSTGMTSAATFVDANSFFYNGVFEESQNLEDWLIETGSKFLLRVSEKEGKKSFKPRLPTNANGTIKTTAITESFGFTEDHVLSNGFEVSYIPLSERKDITAHVLWKQQPDDDLPIMRTAEVSISGLATNGPFEQHDLSQFCCSENHAVKVGAFHVARRKYITHNLRIKVRPSVFNSSLALGDIVRVKLRRETSVDDIEYWDYLYEVERIDKSLSGAITLDLTHFPIDNQGRSLVALAVNSASGSGYTVPSGKASFDCDISGRGTDTTNLSDTGIDYADLGSNGFSVPSSANVSSNFSFDSDMDLGGENPDHPIDNSADPLDADFNNSITDNRGDTDPLAPGDVLTANSGKTCAGGRVLWYKQAKDPETGEATGEKELTHTQTNVSGSTGTLTLTTSHIDHFISAEWQCPDPGSSSGFGNPEPIGVTSHAIETDPSTYSHARWTGTVTTYTAFQGDRTDGYGNDLPDIPESISTTSVTTSWAAGSYTRTGSGALSIGPTYGCALSGVLVTGSDSSFSYPGGSFAPWRSSVTTTQHSDCGGGSLKMGGIWTGSYGNVCSGGGSPKISFGCSTPGSYWTISGKWEFSNDGGSSIAATWGGVD